MILTLCSFFMMWSLLNIRLSQYVELYIALFCQVYFLGLS